MVPPALIGAIVGPSVLIRKLKKLPVGALRIQIGSRLIAGSSGIYLLPVQPLIKGAAVVEHAVQDHPHAPLMDLFHKTGKKGVAGLQIFHIRGPDRIFFRVAVVAVILVGQALGLLYDHPIMGIHMLIVLGVIFVVGG